MPIQVQGKPGAHSRTPPIPAPVFLDHFSGSSLDTTKWDDTYFLRRFNNPELQYFAPDAFVFDGVTVMRIRADTRHMGGYNYTSGCIMSASNFRFRYGRVEGRIRVPNGQGLWSAFWLAGYFDYTSPPEVDIFEVLGNTSDIVRMHVHYPQAPQSDGYNLTYYETSNEFHTYAVNWQPDLLSWEVDGIQRFIVTNPAHIPQVRLFVMLNLSIGGWGGQPDQTTTFPSYLDVDYIKVWSNDYTLNP